MSRTPEDIVTWLNRWGTPIVHVKPMTTAELLDLRRQWKESYPHLEALLGSDFPGGGPPPQES